MELTTHIKTFLCGCVIGSVLVLITYVIVPSVSQKPYREKTIQINDLGFKTVSANVAKNLEKRVKVLCWVETYPANIQKKAIHVKKTWGKRCDILYFMSTQNNTDLPAYGLNVPSTKDRLHERQLKAFQIAYEKYYNQVDWFMKADDDTYVIVENLRYFVSKYSTKEPVYFGHLFKTLVKQGYYSGGAGYVLSKEAIRRLVEKGIYKKQCSQRGAVDDVDIGVCMEKLGVRTMNSTDSKGRSRFHCFTPEAHVKGAYPDWYYKYDANGAKMGAGNMSDYPVSFHYVSPQLMYDLEFYLYKMKVHGE